jgi:Glycosyl hydrolases family 2, sugar binding domain/Glycosyl hydrolases family 2/Glycosyl hydrolases family 2, TIM barrel domain
MKQILSLLFISVVFFVEIAAQSIPLPEHPRPDFERPLWQNLNGIWQFEFDSLDQGLTKKWNEGATPFSLQINVPFPWGSALSGVGDKADIAWYKKEINVSPDWRNKGTFLTIGASDWETTVWLDGKLLGTHQGGYTPFSFELTPHIKYGQPQQLVVRADDKRRDFTLYGKQGYGNARGIWQTVYLEARGKEFIDAIHFAPDIDRGSVTATIYLPKKAARDIPSSITIKTPGSPIVEKILVRKDTDKLTSKIAIPKPRLWSMEDPYLYEAEVQVGDDVVKTYFGMRKISVVNLPGTEFPYIALNNKPVYLQLTLDQSYHPEGFYTFPSDQFMREEIERTKAIGLNGIRPHIKVEIPRKLFWADKLGVLVMADLPNSWGDPEANMRKEAEGTFREMVKRDFNHPAIFSWILFNETWGLRTHQEVDGKKVASYLPETQKWVSSMYYLAKSIDSTRLAEDNSICCGAGHTTTDINSFHDYLPGWEWEEHLKKLTESSFEGSTFQFEAGYKQGKQPKINSECGNVWGYDGSTGDVDWSWDYHRMMNTFRKYPEMAGWLYTEHHDVINEWNGYWRFDRTNKFTGLEELMPGMKLNDFHSPVYLSAGNEICKTVNGGESIKIPLFLSSMTDADHGKQLKLSYQLSIINSIGETSQVTAGTKSVDYQPYLQKEIESLALIMPNIAGLALLTLQLEDGKGEVLHRNFMHFEVSSQNKLPKTEVISVGPLSFADMKWSLKQWNILSGLKVCGAGSGYFEYSIPVSKALDVNSVNDAYFLVELSAKELFVKDRDQKERTDVDFMLGAKASPSGNPNSYPMTDEMLFPSKIIVSIEGETVLTTTLPDDPADHRGVLSWHHQLKDRKLREAGSYGYLTKIPISKEQLVKAKEKGKLLIRFQTEGNGGIAVYGKSFGRYPLDPSLVLKMK